MNKIKVLVVEDSAFMRKELKKILESDPSIEVFLARDGEDGVQKARELNPDVVTMDINLPGIDGITALQYIINENICPVVMVSSLTQEGAMITFEALELGAFDYVPKPGGTVSLNIKKVSEEIVTKVKQAAKTGKMSRVQKRISKVRETYAKRSTPKSFSKSTSNRKVSKAVALGISTGGPKALSEIIPEFPEDLGAALFIVQHMPPNFTKSFATRLNEHSKISIKEADAGEIIQENMGYVGKGGYHLQLRKRPNGEIMTRLTDDIEHFFMPSVGVMMESVLSVFGRNTVGVLMTGMGDDGADAMVKIKQAGGITIAESEETAVVFGMPKEAIERGGADIIVPSYKIVDEVLKALKRLG
ncbi:MAG: chemotaxis response regulator protein-glutamate methylesterase [Leptospiraceae bacterium]|nr:chemotaxis response regulator protein-glutamate methylesterase [Leptospiraceae bacterium]MCP5510433.1 chemotaxis response regulator protein-glutamate methylesterase [Leptospiraceae bacterium]